VKNTQAKQPCVLLQRLQQSEGVGKAAADKSLPK